MKTIHNLIVFDQSGSMECIRRQALSGLNETLQTIRAAAKKYPDMRQLATMLLFNSSKSEFIYKSTLAECTHDLEWNDYVPEACTPLYDAIGQGISSLRDVAEGDEVLVTIITDGLENSSTEFNHEQVQKMIKSKEKEGWTFSFIGTDNLDVEGIARDMGIKYSMSFTQDDLGTKEMFMKTKSAHERFYACCMNDVPKKKRKLFDEEDNDEKQTI